MSPTVKRPLWLFFVPTSCASCLHRLAFHAPKMMFGLSAAAVVMRQSHYRTALADEEADTFDRIDRRAYVAMPDGRMALVYPVVDTQLTPARVVLSFLDAINPMP
ncbi:hypothetical protein ERJ75_000731900 [Trypanosoma vivax]|uniref:Uncharacterized protein n=1 Tax=Trypanosoma vivax (strain Y486) TaxID=1055687 RepID=G0TX78_TRYVY|nr:succinate dehydrogenase cytochrome B subunit [Trypanosoma vivax]KAH8613828.1 hypothetical protein ERJ75_000731900 [Trypanosoma vivax]CCC48568.1 conserved hypothetical protein [Trypanosoma vivax Y486]